MTIHYNEKWVQIAYIDENDNIRFTKEYLEAFKSDHGEAIRFAGHCVGTFEDHYEHMLDHCPNYDKQYTKDQPGLTVGNFQTDRLDVVEHWAIKYAKDPGGFPNFPIYQTKGNWKNFICAVNFHRDILRAKLVTIKIPLRLIENFIQCQPSIDGVDIYDGIRGFDRF